MLNVSINVAKLFEKNLKVIEKLITKIKPNQIQYKFLIFENRVFRNLSVKYICK
jgi:hypothetical protein